jgi:hypothetical protein
MINEYGGVGGMGVARVNISYQRKTAPVPFCPPQIPHDLLLDRTRVTAVGSQQLTVRAMAWSHGAIRSFLSTTTESFIVIIQ